MLNSKIPLYGIIILISIICGVIEICSNLKKLDKEKKIILAVYVFSSSIFGAKYFSLILNYKKIGEDFNFLKSGLSSYGALLGILIIIFVYAKQYKQDYKKILNATLPAIPLMYSIGKIGCFLTGCCHGIEYEGIFSVVYNYSLVAPKGVSLFPIQLLETIVFFIIYILIKNKKNNKLQMCFILCGFAKFILDYLRISHSGVLLSTNQIISIIFIIIGFILIFIKQENNKKTKIVNQNKKSVCF